MLSVNVRDINADVRVRRMSMGHELGHLLWDRDEDLGRLHVDEGEASPDWNGQTDMVGMRANAFAAEFLAPQSAGVRAYGDAEDEESGVSAVMREFGASLTAAKWQIHNGLCLSPEASPTRSPRNTVPGDGWRADGDGTVDYFPTRQTGTQRRGRFGRLSLEACDLNLASKDNAADNLGIDVVSFDGARQGLRGFFQA